MDEEASAIDMDKIIALEGDEDLSNNSYEDDIEVVDGEEDEEQDDPKIEDSDQNDEMS